MSTHNIGFDEKMAKIIIKLSSNIICSSDDPMIFVDLSTYSHFVLPIICRAGL